MKAVLAIVLAALMFAPTEVTAQGLTERAADPADVATIDAIVAAFYDVISHAPGEAIDWARDSTLYARDLRFKIVEGSELQILDHAGYVAAFGGMSGSGFVEYEIHRETQHFGPIAQVWSTYEWRPAADAPVGGRGINAIELFWDGARWWITSAMWASETPENPIPASGR